MRRGSAGGAYGVLGCGKTINLVNSDDIQRAIDKAHERVYGEWLSRIERLTRWEMALKSLTGMLLTRPLMSGKDDVRDGSRFLIRYVT